MRTTFLVACLAATGLILGQADAWAQGRGGGRGGRDGGGQRSVAPRGGGATMRAAPSGRSAAPAPATGRQPSGSVTGRAGVSGGAGARESFYRGAPDVRADADARGRVEGGARVDAQGRPRVDAEGRSRVDADGRARLDADARARTDADARLRDGRDRDGDWDRDRDGRNRGRDGRDWDRYGRRGVRFWLPGYGWTWGYGPRYGYWDGFGWGYGPWGRYGYGPGYYGGGYAYDAPYSVQPGYAVAPRTALGVFMDERDNAVFVRSVVPGSPAEQAGLQPGDMIVAIDGILVTSADQVTQIVAEHQPGEELQIETDRNGRELRTAAVLEEHQRVF